eukprot:662950-Pleurochrysis_carterae.AAC.3
MDTKLTSSLRRMPDALTSCTMVLPAQFSATTSTTCKIPALARCCRQCTINGMPRTRVSSFGV